jgi:hypothetical protein
MDKKWAMTTVELRSEIIALLQKEQNTSILEAIKLLLRRQENEEDLTDEDIAEFDDAISRHDRGEELFHSEEEALLMIRNKGEK